MVVGKTYLVCPLNWGLGHASRLIPVIHDLINKGNQVIIGGDGNALILLKQSFPDLKSIVIPDVSIRLNNNLSLFNYLIIACKILINKTKEHKLLKDIVPKHKIDVIISDNRYGLWHKEIHSILITHQLTLKLPKPFKFLDRMVSFFIKLFIEKFNECWIPDYSDDVKSLSGELSRKYKLPLNAKFINPLTRFSLYDDELYKQKKYHTVAVISGPQPARGKFESILISKFLESNVPTLIIKGNPNCNNSKRINNLTIIPHIEPHKLKYILLNAKVIICRSGYSSIMDLDYLNKKAIVIPTPKQSEQEYLAKLHCNHHIYINQKKLQLLSLTDIYKLLNG